MAPTIENSNQHKNLYARGQMVAKDLEKKRQKTPCN